MKWMSMMVCMGGQRTKIGGSIWWHGKGVGGVTNDMDIESMGLNDGACFGCGRCESGVRWWGS
jgi:hypothetical protein